MGIKQTIFKLILLCFIPFAYADDILPPLPKVDPKKAPLSAIPEVNVSRFIFSGNTVFTDEDLHAITANYQGRVISAEQLQEAKNNITRHYIDQGYINSGAIIPDQQVRNGEIKINVIEGKLVEVKIKENKRVKTSYIKNRLQAESERDKVLKIEDLQEKLQLLQQNPLFKRINAELGPGLRLGEAVLDLAVTEDTPYEVFFTFNNHRSPNIGAYRGDIGFQHINLLGFADRLYLRYSAGLGEGLSNIGDLDSYEVNYTVPVTRFDTHLGIGLERSESKVVTEPFEELKVRSSADTVFIKVEQPVYQTANRRLALELKLEKRKSETFLLDQPFSFSAGVQNGESDITVLRFSQDWLDRSREHVIAARSTFSFGVDWFAPTINDNGAPDSTFITWLGQFQWVQRLKVRSWDTQFLFRTDLQWANQDLLPLEKFSIGGATTVRGYRENELTRDNGLITSIEWRVPIATLPIPKLSQNPQDGLLTLAPFFDYGRSWTSDGETPEPKDISSVGLGLRYAPHSKINAEVYWGKALHHVDYTDKYDLQDEGIHFELSFRWPLK